MRKIIIPVGYMGSGSSAVTDLISEFKGVENNTRKQEFVFLHCPFKSMFSKEEQPLNARSQIPHTPGPGYKIGYGKVNDLRLVHPSKAEFPISVTLFGMMIFCTS